MSSADLLPGVSIVVPVYNSEPTLQPLVERLHRVLTAAHASDFEIILVNDGSRDGSWPVVERLAAQRDYVQGINMMRNYGQHNALLCGIRAARFDRIITIDDDLQNPPEEIPKMLARLDEGLDVVYGRPEKETHGLLRDLASQITKLVLQKAMGAKTARHISAFRAFRTRLRDAFKQYHSPYVSIDVLLTWGTSNFDAILVRHEPRTAGRSNYTVGKLLTHAFNMVTGFSTWPLRMASFIGFAFTFFGIVVLFFVIIAFLLHRTTVSGFTFLASIVAIFAGAQLFAIGIIGEYLARLHFRMMDRPTYAVRNRVGGHEAELETESHASR